MAQFCFANALDNDHGRLARHLVILEQNLPWRAVTEDFGPNRPQFVHQVNAVTGPARGAAGSRGALAFHPGR